MGQDYRGFEFLDILAIMSFMMQVANYQELKSQASTDDIFTEIQKQDQKYLSRILENQEKILNKLSELGTN